MYFKLMYVTGSGNKNCLQKAMFKWMDEFSNWNQNTIPQAD